MVRTACVNFIVILTVVLSGFKMSSMADEAFGDALIEHLPPGAVASNLFTIKVHCLRSSGSIHTHTNKNTLSRRISRCSVSLRNNSPSPNPSRSQ